MGLDMYLTGEKYFRGPRNRGDRTSEQYDLGSWRKHPNLHGYIVNTFANGVDECQEIELFADRIKQIIRAVRDRQLPETTGFFFGTSDDSDSQVEEDVQIFEHALQWLETEEQGVWRSITYHASW